MIDGDCLAAFVAIAGERNFSRAADKLNIVQSVISKRLRRLEDQLGAQLVDRSVRNNICLTRVGELFLPEAAEALAKLAAVECTGHNLVRGVEGPLRIGFVFSAAMDGSLMKLLNGLRRSLPELELQPSLMESPEQLSALEAGQLDLGLMRPRPSYPDRCYAHEVHWERLGICLSMEHRLFGLQKLAPSDLAHERFVVPQFQEQVGLIESIRRLSDAGGFDMPEIIQTQDFVTAACLAATGVGVVLAPKSMARLPIEGMRFCDLTSYDGRLVTVLLHRGDAPEGAIQKSLEVFESREA